jgi:hypothetical protein
MLYERIVINAIEFDRVAIYLGRLRIQSFERIKGLKGYRPKSKTVVGVSILQG